LAAFQIADESLLACDQRPGDTCPTPWDFCCETNLKTHTIAVSFGDEHGKTIESDAKKFFNIKELQTVVIRGKAVRDKANVRLVAHGMYVKR
jgi:hypothetical protein